MNRRSVLVSVLAGLLLVSGLSIATAPGALAAPTSKASAKVRAANRARAVVGSPATYVPISPTRLLDTRSGVGAARRTVRSGETVTLQVAGRGPVPSAGAGAVVLSVTATASTAGGFVTVFPTGVTRPTASNVNYAKGQTVPNLVVVRLGTGGKVNLYNGSSGTVQLLADVSGFYRAGSATAPGSYAAVTPTRVVDTRTGLGGQHQAVPSHGELTFTVSGHAGVPATGVAAVMLNLTATQPAAGGYLTTYPTGLERPTASTLNFAAGHTVPNLVATGLGEFGRVSVFNGSSGTTQVFADVLGYFRDGTADSPGAFVPLPPTRVLDTRKGIGAQQQPVGKNGIRLSLAGSGLPFPNVGQVPSAVAMNVTATGSTASGYLRVESESASNTSNLNFVKGETVAGLVQTPITRNSEVSLVVGSSGTVELIADVTGYYLAAGTLDWTGPTTFDPPTGTPRDVSCASVTFCVVVDESGAVTYYRTGVWSAPDHVNPTSFTAVSCPSSSYCVATDLSGAALTYDGSAWSAPVPVGDSNYVPNDISCTSSSFCLAIDNQGGWYRYDGSGWSARTQLDAGYETSVSCVSPTFCLIGENDGAVAVYDGTTVGERIDVLTAADAGGATVSCSATTACVATDYQQYTATFDGVSWTPRATRDASAYVEYLSCPSGTSCIGFGGSFSGGDGAAGRFDGQSWGAFTPTDTIEGRRPRGLSCPSLTFCVGLESDGFVVTYDGSSWNAPRLIDPVNTPTGLACRSLTFCAAVDAGGSALTYNGTSWTDAVLVDPGHVLTGVACPSTALCFATDDAGRVVRFDGSVGGVGTTAVAAGHRLIGVSCPSATYCAAADDIWALYTWSGTTWTRHEPPTGDRRAVSMDCASSALCAVGGYTWPDGEQTLGSFNGATWSVVNTGGFGTTTSAISCVAPTLCRHVDDSGGSWVSTDGKTWPYAGEVGPSGGNSVPTYLSCVSSYFCAAAGGFGDHPKSFDGATWAQDNAAFPYFKGPVRCLAEGVCITLSVGESYVSGG